MFSTWTMIGIGLSALTLLLPGTAQSRADAVTVTFQDRIKGYDGTRDVSLSQQNPDRSNGKGDDILVGRIFDDDVSRFKGLVRFTNLSIPAGSKTTSAKLSLFCNGLSGKPQIGVFGLLKSFLEGSSRGTMARAGETTWKMLRHGEAAWGAPGVGSGSNGYDFDGPADFHTPAGAVEAAPGARARSVWELRSRPHTAIWRVKGLSQQPGIVIMGVCLCTKPHTNCPGGKRWSLSKGTELSA